MSLKKLVPVELEEAISLHAFDVKKLGETLREVSGDLVKTENIQINCRWFHSAHEVDVYLWQDENKRIIRQQVCWLGQVVEWGTSQGLRSGCIHEQDGRDIPGYNHLKSEMIRMDSQLDRNSLLQAIEILRGMIHIDEASRQQMLVNFGQNP